MFGGDLGTESWPDWPVWTGRAGSCHTSVQWGKGGVIRDLLFWRITFIVWVRFWCIRQNKADPCFVGGNINSNLKPGHIDMKQYLGSGLTSPGFYFKSDEDLVPGNRFSISSAFIDTFNQLENDLHVCWIMTFPNQSLRLEARPR